MLKNVNYNLFEEITQLSKALARYDIYVEDAQAEDCNECAELWRGMRKRHEQDLDVLLRHLKKHVDKGLLELESK